MKKIISRINKILCDLKKFLIDTNSIILIILLLILLLFIYFLFLICQYLGKSFPIISLNISLIEPFILFFTIVASFMGIVYSSYQSNENQKHQMKFDKIYNQLLYLSGKDEYYLGDMSLLKSLLSKEFFKDNEIKVINNIINDINTNHMFLKSIILIEEIIDEKINNIKEININDEKINEEVEKKLREKLLNQYQNQKEICTTKKELENTVDKIIQENMDQFLKEIIDKELECQINEINNEIESLKKYKRNFEQEITKSFEKIIEKLDKLIADELIIKNFNNEIINKLQNTTIDKLNVLSNTNQIILKYIIFYLLDHIKI